MANCHRPTAADTTLAVERHYAVLQTHPPMGAMSGPVANINRIRNLLRSSIATTEFTDDFYFYHNANCVTWLTVLLP